MYQLKHINTQTCMYISVSIYIYMYKLYDTCNSITRIIIQNTAKTV